MATGKYFRALELLKRLDSLPPPSSASASAGGMVVEGRGPVAAVRVKLKAARSYLALGQHKNARPLLDQVRLAGWLG